MFNNDAAFSPVNNAGTIGLLCPFVFSALIHSLTIAASSRRTEHGQSQMSFKEARKLARQIAGDFATLTREEAAAALNISVDTLDKMHRRGEGPPRFRSSVARWAYPLPEFRRWQETRLAEQANASSAA